MWKERKKGRREEGRKGRKRKIHAKYCNLYFSGNYEMHIDILWSS